MSVTTVVNVAYEPFDVYIGRAMPSARDVRCRTASPFANPVRIRKGVNRAESLVRYESLMRTRLASRKRNLWLLRLRQLCGKRLGCWCKPKPCHGDVLVKLINEFLCSEPRPPEGGLTPAPPCVPPRVWTPVANRPDGPAGGDTSAGEDGRDG
jgi:hypothetical protein